MISHRIMITSGLLVVSPLLLSPNPASAQKTPQQIKAELAGLTKEQVVQKYLGSAKGIKFASSWPTNFPVPKYTSNVTEQKFSHSTKGKPSAVASLVTKDSAQTVFNWYMSACQRDGWVVKSPSAKAMANTKSAGKLFMLEGSKDKQLIRIYCMPTARSSDTTVSVNWTKLR